MRILHIMASRVNGGAETYSADVITRLHRAGIEQCVVMHRNAPRLQSLEDAGVRLAAGALRFPIPAVQRHAIANLIAREQPDIVQTWMRRAASLAPRRGPRVFGWFGGYYDPGHFKSCERIVGVTRDIVGHMVRGGVAAGKAHYIPTFPTIEPLPPVRRADLDTPETATVLLTLSRLHAKKGIDTFLKALATIPGAIAWIAGDGPLESDLRRLAAELGVADRARFLGWRDDRAALLGAADVCVLPSRYEPFGTVILEAWAAGVPLVACASAGPAAHVADGETGLLCPVDDAGALSAAINRLVSDKRLRKGMAEAGFAAYARDFTPEAVTRQWIEFYSACLAEKPAFP